MSDMVYRCITGALADHDGVCTEHGESACVIGVRVPSQVEAASGRRDDQSLESASGAAGSSRPVSR